ncbi:MAG: hypothetical protein ACOCP4_00285 [Candidatus Woesearchaeota archaeon]
MFDFLKNNKEEIKKANKEEGEYDLLSEDEIKKLVSRGRFHVRFTFEIAGSPKDHVEKALNLYVDKINEGNNLKFSNVEFLETEKKDNVFVKIVEIEGIIEKGLLSDFIITFMPSYFELIEPSSFKIHAQGIMNLFNGLISKLHQVEMSKKNMTSEYKLLKKKYSNLNKNTNALLKNFLKHAISDGKKSLEELSSIVGIKKEVLEKLLDNLKSEGVVKKSKGFYSIK